MPTRPRRIAAESWALFRLQHRCLRRSKHNSWLGEIGFPNAFSYLSLKISIESCSKPFWKSISAYRSLDYIDFSSFILTFAIQNMIEINHEVAHICHISMNHFPFDPLDPLGNGLFDTNFHYFHSRFGSKPIAECLPHKILRDQDGEDHPLGFGSRIQNRPPNRQPNCL